MAISYSLDLISEKRAKKSIIQVFVEFVDIGKSSLCIKFRKLSKAGFS